MPRKAVLVLVLAFLYFGVRTPFYSQRLNGEEGLFADIFVNLPSRPNFCLVARIDGAAIREPILHPAALYETMKLLGRVVKPLLPAQPSDELVTWRLRLGFALFQFAIWLALALMLLKRAPAEPILTLIFIAITVSPIAIVTSVQLQVDGSSGVFINGIMALAILQLSLEPRPSRIAKGLLFAAAAYVGCGKQEWTLILAAAVFGTILYLRFFHSDDADERLFRGVGVILLGLLIGNVISYGFDPANYVGGLRTFWEITKGSLMTTKTSGLKPWRRLMDLRLSLITTNLVLLGVLGALVAGRFRRLNRYQMLGILYATGLFGAFLISTWNAEPRYFAPSLAALAAAIMSLSFERCSQATRPVLMVLLAIMMVHSVVALRKTVILRTYPEYAQFLNVDPRGCLWRLPTAYTWNKPQLDFINEEMSRKDCTRLAQTHHRSACN